MNRLAAERSPYLLQHAKNPVEWFPWSEEAFETARTEGKPVFLSIGYSSCHWCHVMERESFESEAVAEVLNRYFISVKVDREERPDIDQVYMTFLQAIAGSGGWPMSLFLTPDRKPFFAGTYFPPHSAHGRPGFLQLLERIHDVWTNDRDSLIESSDHIMEVLAERTVSQETATDIQTAMDSTYQYFQQSFDRTEGGFGGAPKFPRPVQFNFLFHYYKSSGNEMARDMALITLRKIASGGMRDQLGGGFHRYSVDRFWRVSHFEKMLYDQAQLVESYLDAWQIAHDEFYRDAARSAIEYVLRDMTHQQGGFFSAEDADSEGEEGKFYTWTLDEFKNELGKDDAEISAYHYGVTLEGNFEHGKNVLFLARSLDDTAERFLASRAEIEERVSISSNKLMTARSRRIRPMLDDKILTSWNGSMIAALARAGDIFEDSRYLEAARKAAHFIWNSLRVEDSPLKHRWREGEARFDAQLDDYSFLIKGFLALYQATFDRVWLERALLLQTEQDAALFDEKEGAYFDARASRDLLLRTKNEYDGAEPAGNTIAADNLFRLAIFTENSKYSAQAERILTYFLGRIGRYPFAMPGLMAAAFWHVKTPIQIVLSGTEIQDFNRAINERYLPLSVKMLASSTIAPFARSLPTIQSKAAAYVCQNFACELPVTDRDALEELLDTQ